MTDDAAVERTWVPDACTLPTQEQPVRVAQFGTVFSTAVTRIERPAPEHLRLSLTPGEATFATVQDLVARESACCSFFDFELSRESGGTRLDVRVPPERVPVLDALQQLALAP